MKHRLYIARQDFDKINRKFCYACKAKAGLHPKKQPRCMIKCRSILRNQCLLFEIINVLRMAIIDEAYRSDVFCTAFTDKDIS